MDIHFFRYQNKLFFNRFMCLGPSLLVAAQEQGKDWGSLLSPTGCWPKGVLRKPSLPETSQAEVLARGQAPKQRAERLASQCAKWEMRLFFQNMEPPKQFWMTGMCFLENT